MDELRGLSIHNSEGDFGGMHQSMGSTDPFFDLDMHERGCPGSAGVLSGSPSNEDLLSAMVRHSQVRRAASSRLWTCCQCEITHTLSKGKNFAETH